MLRRWAMNQLVLSIFPGIDLLGRAFAAAGFAIVTGPDPITGGDIRDWRGIAGRFDGIIGGPPCQGFSCMNTQRTNPDHHSVVNSRSLLREFCRIVHECQPQWFLCENVPAVPDVRVPGYQVQRLAISDWECAGTQIRVRHIQFGRRDGWIIRPVRERETAVNQRARIGRKPEAITTKPVSKWSAYTAQCKRQGFDEIKLPGWTKEAKFRAVGNGVPFTIGFTLARAVAASGPRNSGDCPCGCGRVLAGMQCAATATCRKRLQLDRERSRPFVDLQGWHPEQVIAAR